MGTNGVPEEDHQLHQCCWTGRVGEREEEEDCNIVLMYQKVIVFNLKQTQFFSPDWLVWLP